MSSTSTTSTDRMMRRGEALEVCRHFHFSAAHRLRRGYKGKCRSLHGHNYLGEVRLGVAGPHPQGLDDHGMLMDFKELKVLDDWVQANWDHDVLVDVADEPLRAFCEDGGDKFFTVFSPTTAENLVLHLSQQFDCLLALRDSYLRVSFLRLYETPKYYVDYVNYNRR